MLLLGLCLAMGCATPEARYRVLSVFFDDVPVPESLRPSPPPPSQEALPAEHAAAVPSPLPGVEWVVHEAECDECHSSKTDKLAYLPAPELCWECHDEEDFVGKVAHGPFDAGACLQCHNPHKSPNPTLLVAALPQLCESCHDDTTFPELAQHRAEDGDDCIGCHNPHAAARMYMLESDRAAVPGAPAAIVTRASEPAP